MPILRWRPRVAGGEASPIGWARWQGWAGRYSLALMAVGGALGLRELLTPLTGRGAPFVLFFGATLVTSLLVGVGPGLLALVISLPLAAFMFIVRAGESWGHASFQALLYAVDGLIIIYLMNRTRRARRALEVANDERQVFVSLIENASDFIGIADPAGTPIYVNPAGRKLVGLGPDQPIERTRIPDYYPPDQRSFASDVIVKSMVERGRWAGETYFRNWQTEAAIPVSDAHFMIRDASGKRVLGMGTITRDISEARRVEGEQRFLAEAGAVLASSLDYEETLAAVGRLAVRDFADCCVVDVLEENGSPRRLKVVSRDPKRAPLCEALERFPLDRGRPHLAMPVLETGRAYRLERVRAEDLAEFAQSPEHLGILRELDPRSLLGVPLVIRGRLLGVIVFISSTPSRVFGPDDARLAEALANRAALAIENGRLYREAVQAKSLRDNVLGVVAHDLRNPLATILLQANALRRTGPEPERRKQRPVEAIERAASRMNRLIEDLLDVTRLEGAHLGLERAWIVPEGLLRTVVESQSPLAIAASLQLDLELCGPLPRMWGDRQRLEQVLENLVGNAIKFTGPGGRIRIGAQERGGDLMVWVGDTGRGITPEELPRVFDPFWQAQRATRRGAGLGLPIARGIVEAHGGRIWVESTPGVGSTFFLSIPTRASGEAPGTDAGDVVAVAGR